jgi:hypothetical protein
MMGRQVVYPTDEFVKWMIDQKAGGVRMLGLLEKLQRQAENFLLSWSLDRAEKRFAGTDLPRVSLAVDCILYLREVVNENRRLRNNKLGNA